MDKKLSKTELIERLKAIAVEEVPENSFKGRISQCYAVTSSSPLSEKHRIPSSKTCSHCGKELTYYRCLEALTYETDIPDLVKEMSELGYDVKLEYVCEDCCKKLKEELYPNIGEGLVFDVNDEKFMVKVVPLSENYVFYFRTDSTLPYHCAIANKNHYYRIVLSFLQGKSLYRDKLIDEDIFLAREIHIIEFMTGLKIDE